VAEVAEAGQVVAAEVEVEVEVEVEEAGLEGVEAAAAVAVGADRCRPVRRVGSAGR
jgi:hypothetical protein